MQLRQYGRFLEYLKYAYLNCEKIARGRGQSSTPADRDTLTTKGTLNILQLNVQGLQRKTEEVKDILEKQKVHVALLQELFHHPKKK